MGFNYLSSLCKHSMDIPINFLDENYPPLTIVLSISKPKRVHNKSTHSGIRLEGACPNIKLFDRLVVVRRGFQKSFNYKSDCA